MVNRNNGCAWTMFLMGLFSQTQVRIIGSIGISELILFAVAPFVFVLNYATFKRDGILLALRLLSLAMVGCVISSWYNETAFPAVARGLASPYGFWACLVVFYVLLRKSPMSFKWYLLGAAFSFILCTFYFQQAYEVTAAEGFGYGADAEGIMSGPIYWIGRLGGFIIWPIQSFYLQCPIWFSASAVFLFGSWSLLTSASGRSAALVAMASAMMIILGGKSRIRMIKISKNLFPFLIVSCIFVFCFKTAYSHMAINGHLGEEARVKYERQTQGKDDLVSILMGGRGLVFIGLFACAKNPIIGYGPWARDKYGIIREFMAKYGTSDDYETVLKIEQYNSKMGRFGTRLIPGHSAIVAWWLWYGILGLPIWLYIIYLIYDLLRYRIATFPELFGYFACVLPSQLWAMFFSPFGARMPWAFFVTMLLVNRAINKNSFNSKLFLK